MIYFTLPVCVVLLLNFIFGPVAGHGLRSPEPACNITFGTWDSGNSGRDPTGVETKLLCDSVMQANGPSWRPTNSPVGFLHGPLCITLVSRFFRSNIMLQPNRRVLISIVPKVALLKSCVDIRSIWTWHSPTKDVFRFTLYWTLIFYIPLFLLCGFYAFWNYAFPPSPHPPSSPKSPDSAHQLSTIAPISAAPLIQLPKIPKTNERRSRVTFAFIVLMTFLTLSLAGAVTGAAVLGFITAGLFKAADFNMSTCVIHFTC